MDIKQKKKKVLNKLMKGKCGGTRKFDGSGGGIGNRGTSRQPKK